jgi:hypothetical protein
VSNAGFEDAGVAVAAFTSTGGSRRTCWMAKKSAMPEAATNAMDSTTIRLSDVVVMMLVRRPER